MSRFYFVARAVVNVVFRALYRPSVEGEVKLPDGPVILVSNHISNWDVVLLGCAVDRQIHYMAKKELFKYGPMRALMEALGAFPVDRGGADVSAIRTSLSILGEGGVIGIFPQGTRVKDDSSFEMAGGASMIALRSRAQLVPVHITGPYRLFRRVQLRLGEPFVPGAAGARISRELIDETNAQVTQRVLALRGDK